jgi:CII-binding regulator of phage lambda lysogenization HflD
MQDALRRQDQEAANRIAEMQCILEEKVEQSRVAQNRLKTDLHTLQKEREAEAKRIEKVMQELAVAYKEKSKKIQKLQKKHEEDWEAWNERLMEKNKELAAGTLWRGA